MLWNWHDALHHHPDFWRVIFLISYYLKSLGSVGYNLTGFIVYRIYDMCRNSYKHGRRANFAVPSQPGPSFSPVLNLFRVWGVIMGRCLS